MRRKVQRADSSEEVIRRLVQRQEQQILYHDRGCKPLPTLLPNQKITIQDLATHKWMPATVREKIYEIPRSYNITTASGSGVRRNRSHIREAPSISPDVKQDSTHHLTRLPATKMTYPPSQGPRSSLEAERSCCHHLDMVSQTIKNCLPE